MRTGEPVIRSLDSVRIGASREFIEFCFRDANGAEQAIQIDFAYVESLAGLFQQTYVSWAMEAREGANRSHGHEYLSVPRVDIEYPIGVAVDLMTERVVAMFMLGTPFQVCYSMPTKIARMLSADLRGACDQVPQQIPAVGRSTN